MKKDYFMGVRIPMDLKNWLGNENLSKKVRKILAWCYESYPDIEKLLELIEK